MVLYPYFILTGKESFSKGSISAYSHISTECESFANSKATIERYVTGSVRAVKSRIFCPVILFIEE